MRVIIPLLSLASLLAWPLTATIFYVSAEEPLAPHFTVRDIQKNATTFSAAVVRTQGATAYNAGGSQAPFLEQYGVPSIKNLYKGLNPQGRSLSERFFSADGDESVTALNAQLRFNDRFNYYLHQSYHAALTHYLFSGLFFRLQTHLVDQTIAQKARASGADAENSRITSLTTHFDQFLGENGHSALSYNNRQINLEQAGLFFGWNGKTLLEANLIKEISGSIMAGYTFAPTHFDHPLAPAFIPHNITHGYNAQVALNAQVSNHLAIDVCAGTTIYGRYIDTMHVVCDDSNAESFFAGPPVLGRGKVRKDPGTVWALELAVMANRFWGFFVSGGYHFSYQEQTRLFLEDTTILQNSGLSLSPGKQNERLNSDPRLGNWKNHAMFLKAGYAPSSNHRIIPDIDFAVYWPVMGHCSASATRIYAGTAQLSIRWTF